MQNNYTGRAAIPKLDTVHQFTQNHCIADRQKSVMHILCDVMEESEELAEIIVKLGPLSAAKYVKNYLPLRGKLSYSPFQDPSLSRLVKFHTLGTTPIMVLATHLEQPPLWY